MSGSYHIELASAADVEQLPAIELLSGEPFRNVLGLEWIADEDPMSAEEFLPFAKAGTLWFAREEVTIIGFLAAEKIATDLHVWQVSVLPNWQKQGVGRAMFAEVSEWAKRAGLNQLTLTTFRDIAFNEKFYASLGFKTLHDADTPKRLLDELAEEAEHGLPREQRCAMILELG